MVSANVMVWRMKLKRGLAMCLLRRVALAEPKAGSQKSTGQRAPRTSRLAAGVIACLLFMYFMFNKFHIKSFSYLSNLKDYSWHVRCPFQGLLEISQETNYEFFASNQDHETLPALRVGENSRSVFAFISWPFTYL